MTTPPVPFPRSYWVIPGKLLAGCYPGAKDPKEATAEERVLGESQERGLDSAGLSASRGSFSVHDFSQMSKTSIDGRVVVNMKAKWVKDYAQQKLHI
jgi:hypothetical protein